MAKTNPTQPKKPTPPQPGSRPSIRVDDALADDLAVLMSTGANLSDAIRAAVRQSADMHRTAWANGIVPRGTAPRLLAYQLEQKPTRAPRPTSPYAAASDKRPTPHATGRRIPAPPIGQTHRA
ncbi:MULTISPECIES: hypothetical protein [Streptomyces]|uniref:Uncharacterized protein n=1 Tax=Streptomyces dengpaensis TaxID=2049881 RepID=A0ABN5I5P2_9ACTN|nr:MULTISPECIES: hypothetical protein [Streptomyces]AVH58394.1 hypothetical protein C4B68_24440 [Streptomyces dengpaensis]PIB06069.1 hypothetical protein B1C81_26160 [Streptomyces sp. HG99]